MVKLNKIFAGLVAAGMLLQVTGCGKQEQISETPAIEFVSITPNPAVKYQDEIAITIQYTDGDGDLGESAPDVKNAFITDSRNNVTYEFKIPQQAPDNSTIIIKGSLTFHLSPQGFVDDSNTSESTTYSIHIVDRAGHVSNTVETPALVINN